MNMSYDPMEFAILMDMNMNEQSIYSNQVSGKNPPPLCLPVPLGAIPLPPVDMCIKMFNIFTPGYNLHMCMDIMARYQGADIMVSSTNPPPPLSPIIILVGNFRGFLNPRIL
jgi:hypothetical protein